MNQRFKKVMLGDIATISSGGTPSRSKPQYWGGKIPWVKTTQIQNCIINANDVDECITEEGLAKSSAKMVPKGTILIAMIGQGKTRGQVGLLNILATTNQNAASLVLREGVSNSYVFQSILHNYNGLRALSNDSGQGNLNLKLIKQFKIPYTDYPEQKAIADVLSTWDQAIEKTQQLIKAKEKQLQSYGVELFSKSSRKSKGAWKLFKLSDILNEHKQKSSGEEEVFSVSVHKGLINQIEHLGRSFSAANTDHYNKVCHGDIVYTKSPTGDFPHGVVKQSYVEEDVTVSPLYGVFSPENFYIGVILDFYFSSPLRVKNYLFPIIQKGAKNTIAITNKTFLSKSLFLPQDEVEQKGISDFIQVSLEEITLMKKLLTQYQTQKRGLMQRLLSGEWRVKLKNQ